MKKAQLCWIIASPFLLAFIAYLIFQGREEVKQAKIKKTSPLYSKAYPEIAGFSLTEYLSGKKKMEIKAEKASIRPKKIGFFKTPLIKEAHMVKPEILFFTEGKEVSHIMANSGKMNMSNKKMFFKGDVTLVTSDNKSLSTKEMAVDPKNGLLSIRGRFTLKKGSEIIKGKGLKSDIELKNL